MSAATAWETFLTLTLAVRAVWRRSITLKQTLSADPAGYGSIRYAASAPRVNMQLFDIQGPIEVPCYQGVGGRVVDRDSVGEFWTHYPALAKKRGCYVYGFRASRGYTPVYVGKATKSFKQECFTHHKLEHYNRALVDYAKGTPVLFFVSAPGGRGRVNAKAIGEIERFLIAMGEAANPDLSNIQNRSRERWGIRGVVRSGKGKRSKSAAEFRRLMNL